MSQSMGGGHGYGDGGYMNHHDRQQPYQQRGNY